MYITDKGEISSNTLSKETFFSLVFDLPATLATNYHKNKKMKIIIIKKNVVLAYKRNFLCKFTKWFFLPRAKLYKRFQFVFNILATFNR